MTLIFCIVVNPPPGFKGVLKFQTVWPIYFPQMQNRSKVNFLLLGCVLCETKHVDAKSDKCLSWGEKEDKDHLKALRAHSFMMNLTILNIFVTEGNINCSHLLNFYLMQLDVN